jgi:hypothetical protein
LSNDREDYPMVTLASLAQTPVWWRGDDEELRPVDDYEPLPEDRGDLYLKTELVTPGGVKLPGCVLSMSRHFVVLFVGDEAFYFNANMAPLQSDLERLNRLVPALGGRIFPLRFATPFHFPGEPPIAGEFDIKPLKFK